MMLYGLYMPLCEIECLYLRVNFDTISTVMFAFIWE